ncbi:MAG: polysaccharide biosynthesis/export family protein [Bacteroidota bacterium]
MLIINKLTLFTVATLCLLSSCGINSNLMFKEAKGVAAITDSIPMSPKEDYRIASDDRMSFTLSTNDGKGIIESLSGIKTEGQGQPSEFQYTVRQSGVVELPIVGDVMVKGMTIEECEDTLQLLYAKEYQSPFIQVKITNQRVIVFPGNGADAKVVPLMNNNTTLMEAIAQAGGIPERGKSKSIKLMRKEGGERKVYRMDLSKIEGLKFADMIVQGNDYIYIEPNAELAKGVLKEAAPIVSILSSALIIFTVFRNL